MNIFLSRPTWIPPEFEPGINTFLTQLENLGLVPRTLGVSDYPSKAPLDEVIDILTNCKGAIILGVPQIAISVGSIKGKAIESPIELGTEWNHLEAGLAYAAGLPVLIIHHQSISRGIFDRGVLNAFLHKVDLSENNWSMQHHLNGAIRKWKEKCTQGVSNFHGTKPATSISLTNGLNMASTADIFHNELQETAPVQDANVSSISFLEITNAIEKMPPLQQESFAKNYKGLKVNWEAYFKSGNQLDTGFIRIRLKPSKDISSIGSSIICKVRDSEYPQLRILREGAIISVRGEIEAADRFDITLTNTSLSISS